ncbi:hypothetical protein PSEUBRA_004877 [Kalmanozyma brasiliensis GHG001]|uniref:Wax synthase domain-containing protein n=1 Tax=Kalmanozyma brasiliensis (strain GHG001) TaxID=1365824 RepID=V5E6E6_KALBG|nr:uncharacterized protein PSEUBRA_004877 [Kalmanozyma brasiliensis GHG001]EST05841.1 hypothetical protein PSEUBRA_004877 [Kalmanozyma brasiliensis GHG001]
MDASLQPASTWDSIWTVPLRWAVKDFHDKKPYDSSSAWIIASHLPLTLLQIHLLIRYDPKSTWLLRATLVPIISLLALRSAFAFYSQVDGLSQLDGKAQQVNMTLGCYAAAMIARALQFGLARRRPQLKVAKTKSNGADHVNGKEADPIDMPIFFPGTRWPLEIDLLLNVRGVGWEHGVKEAPPALPVQTNTSSERWTWICERMAPIPLYYLVHDVIVVLIADPRFNVHAGGTSGGSLWDCSRGSFGFAGPYLVCLAFAFSFACNLHMMHTALSCLSVAILGDPLSRWEPRITDKPWLSSSVGEFWAERWHQYLRITFLTVGYWPVRDALRPIAGRRIASMAGICGAFLASGILHELGRAAMMPSQGSFLTPVTLFFAIQPVALFAERWFETCTSRKVRGIWGWAWTMTWMLATAPLLCEAMSQGGMLVAKNQTLNLTHRPVTWMLDWWDRLFNAV